MSFIKNTIKGAVNKVAGTAIINTNGVAVHSVRYAIELILVGRSSMNSNKHYTDGTIRINEDIDFLIPVISRFK